MTPRLPHPLFPSLILLAIFSVAPAFGQWDWYNRVTFTDDGVMMGGLGMAFIDDETFFVFNLRAELALGQFGVGSDVPLRFNTENGELRDADWNSTYDYFRILRYIRYGTKCRTPVYARLGTLSTAKLGHGVCRKRSRIAEVAAVSPRILPQSSMGRLVAIMLAPA